MYKKWAPSELRMFKKYKKDPWASSELPVSSLSSEMKTKGQHNPVRAAGMSKRTPSHLVSNLLAKLEQLVESRRVHSHPQKRAADHPIPVGVGTGAATAAWHLYEKIFNPDTIQRKNIDFVG
jgi:hypothetical protein